MPKYRISKKILTDGSVYMDDNKAVASYVISNGDKEIARGSEIFRYEDNESEFVEARAIRLGIERAISLGVKNISVGCDNRNIVDAIREGNRLAEYKDVQDVLDIVEKTDSFSIFHVDRKTVEPAHNLGRRMYQ